MKKNVREYIEKYILESAQTPKRKGLIPINVWSLFEGDPQKTETFEEIYKDGGIDALTRPLKISVGGMHKDWYGMIVHTFRQIKPKQIIPARPSKTPMLDMYDRKGQRIKRTIFAKTPGSTKGMPVSFYTVDASVGGVAADRMCKLFSEVYLMSTDGNKWAEIYKSGVYSPDWEFNTQDSIKLAIGLQCFTEYCWTVEFCYDNHSMPVLFPVSQRTARKLVSETETASEGERRKKVIHFVQAHERFTKIEEEEPSPVMMHMRGCMYYLWQGCKMKVMPPVNNLYSFERNTKKIQSVRKAVFQSQ